MTKKIIGTTAALIAALAFAGCSSGTAGDDTNGNVPGVKGTGTVNFNLDLPNGESISSINLHLSCTGIEQDHVLDVEDGEIVAAFGGLTPGACTVTMDAETSDGIDCSGSKAFTVVTDQTAEVTVTLLCQGSGDDPQGRAQVRVEIDVEECTADRIKKIYAIPANVLTGETTTIEVETWPGSVQGTATYSFAAVTDATHTAEGTLSPSATCASSSASCSDFTCESLGAVSTTDPSSGLPTAGVWIEVTVEDADCFDTEKVWVDCLQASVCGDTEEEGAEECDDGNTDNNDGCSSTCKDEVCGDGIKQTSEECDGTDGVGPGQACNEDCELETAPPDPFCGDGIQQAGEECDGNDGLENPAVQECSVNCEIVPDCGNGIEEGTEACDDGNQTPGDGCEDDCTTSSESNVCEDCISLQPGLAEFNDGCSGDPLCAAVKECVFDSGCFLPTSGDCFCGIGFGTDAACENGTRAADGPCVNEIRAAAGNDSPVQSVILQRYFNDAYPLGVAMTVVQFAGQLCVAECPL